MRPQGAGRPVRRRDRMVAAWRSRHLAGIVAAASVAVILVLTMYPFRLRTAGEPLDVCALACGERWLPDMFRNVMLFIPLGFGLRRFGWSLGAAVGACIGFAIGIEIIQFWLPRSTTLQDVCANGVGGAAGAVLGRRRTPGTMPSRLRAAGYVLVVIGLAGVLGWAVRIDGWDPSYPVAWGAEPDGSRTWHGVVVGATWCAGTEQRRQPCHVLEEALRMPAGEIRAAESEQSFEVRVEAIARRLDEQGPARIVTSSLGPDLRNFTVAQLGPDLVFRFRSRLTGLNGSRPEWRLRNAFVGAVNGRVLITAAYRRGRVTLGVRGESSATETSYRLGPWSLWMALMGTHAVLSALCAVLNATTVLVLMAPVGYVGAIWRRRTPGAVLVLLSMALILYVIPFVCGLAPGSPVLWLAGGIGGMVGYACGARLNPGAAGRTS